MGTLHFAHSMVSAVLGGVKLDSLTVSANSEMGVVLAAFDRLPNPNGITNLGQGYFFHSRLKSPIPFIQRAIYRRGVGRAGAMAQPGKSAGFVRLRRPVAGVSRLLFEKWQSRAGIGGSHARPARLW